MVAKRWKSGPPAGVTEIGWCPRDSKYLYGSRKDARRAGKDRDPGGHPNAYECRHLDGWHWGHLGPSVAGGHMTKHDRYVRLPELGRRNP